MTILDAALAYQKAGLSILPAGTNKRPMLSAWTHLQKKPQGLTRSRNGLITSRLRLRLLAAGSPGIWNSWTLTARGNNSIPGRK